MRRQNNKPDEYNQRDLEYFLHNELKYPTNKYELLMFADEIELDGNIRSILEALPDDHYDTPEEILAALPAAYRLTSTHIDASQ